MLTLFLLVLYLVMGFYVAKWMEKNSEGTGLFGYDRTVNQAGLSFGKRLKSAVSSGGFLEVQLQKILTILSWPGLLIMMVPTAILITSSKPKEIGHSIIEHLEQKEDYFEEDHEGSFATYQTLSPFKIFGASIANISLYLILFLVGPLGLPEQTVTAFLSLFTLELLLRETLMSRRDILQLSVLGGSNQLVFFLSYAIFSFFNILFAGFMLFAWDRSSYAISLDDLFILISNILDFESFRDVISQLNFESLYFYVFGLIFSVNVLNNILLVFNFKHSRKTRLRKAELLNDIGNYDKAQDYLSQIPSPERDSIYFQEMCCAHLGKSEWEKAYENAKKVVQLNSAIKEGRQLSDPCLYLGYLLSYRIFKKEEIQNGLFGLIQLGIKDLYLNHTVNRLVKRKGKITTPFWKAIFDNGEVQSLYPITFAIRAREVGQLNWSNEVINNAIIEEPLEHYVVLILEFSYLVNEYINNLIKIKNSPGQKMGSSKKTLEDQRDDLDVWIDLNINELFGFYQKLENDRDRLIAMSFYSMLVNMAQIYEPSFGEELHYYIGQFTPFFESSIAKEKCINHMSHFKTSQSLLDILESTKAVHWVNFQKYEIL